MLQRPLASTPVFAFGRRVRFRDGQIHIVAELLTLHPLQHQIDVKRRFQLNNDHRRVIFLRDNIASRDLGFDFIALGLKERFYGWV